MDRASTFSDPTVIKRLQTEFIPVAANTADVQWSNTPASRWFMAVAKQVNYRARSGETTQGFYVAGSDGKGYDFDNVRDPKVVIRLLDSAFTEMRANPPAKVAYPKSDIEAPFSKSPDPNTSVIRIFTRIRPLPMGAHKFNKYVGRDHLWITGQEIKQMAILGEPGKTFEMPKTLSGRIARFHLVDNVRGEPDLWDASETRAVDVKLKLISKAGVNRTYSIKGAFKMKTDDGKRGENCQMAGEFTISRATYRILKFRAVTQSDAWGAGKFTPLAPEGVFPIARGMLDVDDRVSHEVPPQAVSKGGDYFAPKCACFVKS